MAEFSFGDNVIHLDKGTKSTGDYVIYHNRIKFTDLFLFRGIIAEISSEKLARDFIRCCISYSEFQFNHDALSSIHSPLDVNDVYEYCTALDLKSEIQEILFLWILRIDIDNINYRPPQYNGGIRIFTQVLILLAYKFKWSQYYVGSIPKDMDIPTFIYRIGHPGYDVSLDRADFQRVYREFLKNKEEIAN